jgi:hypothetical protein
VTSVKVLTQRLPGGTEGGGGGTVRIAGHCAEIKIHYVTNVKQECQPLSHDNQYE